jgi:hypothetical protein
VAYDIVMGNMFVSIKSEGGVIVVSKWITTPKLPSF